MCFPVEGIVQADWNTLNTNLAVGEYLVFGTGLTLDS